MSENIARKCIRSDGKARLGEGTGNGGGGDGERAQAKAVKWKRNEFLSVQIDLCDVMWCGGYIEENLNVLSCGFSEKFYTFSVFVPFVKITFRWGKMVIMLVLRHSI